MEEVERAGARERALQIPIPPLWIAVIYGVVVAVTYAVGGVIAKRWSVPNRIIGIGLAFSAGALIAAIGLELVFVPFTKVGALPVIAAATVGAVVFALVDFTLERKHQRGGWGLLAEQVTEGIPESLAVGATAGGAALTLLVAVAISNVADGIAGTVELHERRIEGWRPVMAWAAVGAGLFAMVMLGYLSGKVLGSDTIAVLNAVAGGAALAGVASEFMPEAYKRSGLWVTLATVAGFLLSFWLFSIAFEPSSVTGPGATPTPAPEA